MINLGISSVHIMHDGTFVCFRDGAAMSFPHIHTIVSTLCGRKVCLECGITTDEAMEFLRRGE